MAKQAVKSPTDAQFAEIVKRVNAPNALKDSISTAERYGVPSSYSLKVESQAMHEMIQHQGQAYDEARKENLSADAMGQRGEEAQIKGLTELQRVRASHYKLPFKPDW